jgi:hypothetical protein
MLKIVPKFYGNVTNGKLTLINIERFNKYLTGLSGDIELTVAKKTNRRSTKQNKYLFGVIYKIISDYTGYDVDKIHELMKNNFGVKEVVALGNINTTVSISTTLYSTEQFNEYKNSIQQWASETLDLQIPDPEEVQLK